MFIIVIPVAVVPHFRNVTYVGTISEAEEISTLPIIENFNKIKELIKSTEDELISQSENIDKLVDELISEIERRNIELREINQERADVLTELEYYKTIASLTKEQSDAVYRALQRARYIDYIVGFAIGIFTSGFFFMIQHFYFRRYFGSSKSSRKS